MSFIEVSYQSSSSPPIPTLTSQTDVFFNFSNVIEETSESKVNYIKNFIC